MWPEPVIIVAHENSMGKAGACAAPRTSEAATGDNAEAAPFPVPMLRG
jgi:hypothetical protein